MNGGGAAAQRSSCGLTPPSREWGRDGADGGGRVRLVRTNNNVEMRTDNDITIIAGGAIMIAHQLCRTLGLHSGKHRQIVVAGD